MVNEVINKVRALAPSVDILLYITAFLFVFSYLVLSAPAAGKFLVDPDQGVQLAQAQQIINGFHPFVDMAGGSYGPLIFYGSALGQYVSGNRLVGEVGLIVLGYTAAYMLLFYLCLKLSGSRVMSGVLLVFQVFLMPRFYKYYIVLAPALMVVMLNVFLRSRKSSGIVALAFGVAITTFYRLDFGFHAFVVSVVAIFLKEKKDMRLVYGDLLRLILAGLFFASPWLIFLGIKGNLIDIIRETIYNCTKLSSGLSLPVPRFNFQHSVLSRHNVFPFQFWFVFSIPITAVSLVAVRWRVIKDKERCLVICMSLFALMVFTQALHRSDYPHFLQVIALPFVIAGWIMRQVSEIIFSQKISVWSLLSCLGLALFISAGDSFTKSFHKTCGVPTRQKLNDLPIRISHYSLSRGELRDLFRKRQGGNWRVRVVDYVYKNVPEKGRVLFLPFAPQLYYYSERLYGTPRGHFYPGMFPTPESQFDFIEKMADTSLVVDLPAYSYDGRADRNARHYAGEIMKYIYAHYRLVKRFGPANVLVRKPGKDFKGYS